MKFIEKCKSLIQKVIDKFTKKETEEEVLDDDFAEKVEANIEALEAEEEVTKKADPYVLPNVSEEKRAEARKVVEKSEKALERKLEKDIKAYSDLQDDANKIHDEIIKEVILAKANKLADKVTKASAKTNVPTETLIEKYLVEHAIKDLNDLIKEEAILTKSQKRYVRKVKTQKEAERLTHLNEIYTAQIERIQKSIAGLELSQETYAILDAKIKAIGARIDKNLKLLGNKTLLTESAMKKAERANLKKVKASHSAEMNDYKEFKDKIECVEADFIKSANPKPLKEDSHVGLEIVEL